MYSSASADECGLLIGGTVWCMCVLTSFPGCCPRKAIFPSVFTQSRQPFARAPFSSCWTMAISVSCSLRNVSETVTAQNKILWQKSGWNRILEGSRNPWCRRAHAGGRRSGRKALNSHFVGRVGSSGVEWRSCLLPWVQQGPLRVPPMPASYLKYLGF